MVVLLTYMINSRNGRVVWLFGVKSFIPTVLLRLIYLTVATIYRGRMSMRDVDEQMINVQSKNS
ncbi:hypothetical protein Avbf_10527, partial [Armadillidium vulgare]